MISSRVVVLPQPDSPTMARHSPSRISKVMPSTALTVPTLRLINAPLVSGNCLRRSFTARVVLRSSRGTSAKTSSESSGGLNISSPSILRSWISGARRQALRWEVDSSLSGISSGSPERQASCATGQRGANWQRSFRSTKTGGLPSMGVRGSEAEASGRGVEPSRPTV